MTTTNKMELAEIRNICDALKMPEGVSLGYGSDGVYLDIDFSRRTSPSKAAALKTLKTARGILRDALRTAETGRGLAYAKHRGFGYWKTTYGSGLSYTVAGWRCGIRVQLTDEEKHGVLMGLGCPFTGKRP